MGNSNLSERQGLSFGDRLEAEYSTGSVEFRTAGSQNAYHLTDLLVSRASGRQGEAVYILVNEFPKFSQGLCALALCGQLLHTISRL